MLYYNISLNVYILNLKRIVVDIVSIIVWVVIGVAVGLFLDIDMFSKKYADEEEKFDSKEEHNEGK